MPNQESQPDNAPLSAAAPIVVDERAGNPQYGIRGWLLLYCVGLTVVTPLILVFDALHSKDMFSTICDLVQGAFSIYLGVCLLRVQEHALGVLKVYFAVMALIGVLVLLGAVVDLRSHSLLEPEYADRFAVGCRILAPVLIWWSYFRKSERVRITFGRNI